MNDSNTQCDQIELLLFGMDEGFPDALSADERARVDDHLKNCSACRALRNKEQQLTAILAGADELYGQPNNLPNSQSASPADNGPRSQEALWKTIAAIAATIAIVVSIGALTVRHRNHQLAETLRQFEGNETAQSNQALANLGSYSIRPVTTNVSFNPSEETWKPVALKLMNHYDLPIGMAATIELTGAGSIKAVGPATFGIDQVAGQWKVSWIDGQARISVLDECLIAVAGKQGLVELDPGVHLVSVAANTLVQQSFEPTKPKIEQTDSDNANFADTKNIEALLDEANAVFRVGGDSSKEAYENSVELYQRVIDHADSSDSQLISATFYLSAALANAKHYQSALDTATAFESKYPQSTSEVTLSIICESNWHLGNHRAAKAAFDKLTKQFPETPYRDGLQTLLGSTNPDSHE